MEGEVIGKMKSILELLEIHGEIPEELRRMILSEKDDNRLRQWLKAAAVSESIEQFQARINGKQP